MKRNICILLIVFTLCPLFAQEAQTYLFVERDTALHLDIYRPEQPNGYTVVHIFGGGFIGGARNTNWDASYCRLLAQNGYTAVAIDYRLGLRGVGNVSLTNISALEHAFYIATEDCAAAIAYLTTNAEILGIDPSRIILEGSSAGAITALMTDYARCNGLPCASALPKGWKPAGVIAYSGAIYSKQGKVKWEKDTPTPTLLFHGTADRIVPYNKIEFFRIGLYGADPLSGRFDKFGHPYCIYRYTDLGHEVSIAGPRTIDELNLFVKQYIGEARRLSTDITTRDEAIPPTEYSKKTRADLYAPGARSDL